MPFCDSPLPPMSGSDIVTQRNALFPTPLLNNDILENLCLIISDWVNLSFISVILRVSVGLGVGLKVRVVPPLSCASLEGSPLVDPAIDFT